jgi:hypothetical protein
VRRKQTASPGFADRLVVMSRNHHPPSTFRILDHQASSVAITRKIPHTLEHSFHTSHNTKQHTMSSRALSMTVRRLATASTTPALSRRSFQSSARMLEVPAGVMPVRKPVGAFRGGFVSSTLYPFPLLLGLSSPASDFFHLLHSLASCRVTWMDMLTFKQYPRIPFWSSVERWCFVLLCH